MVHKPKAWRWNVIRQKMKGLAAVPPADYLRPTEVGEMVVPHVLENVPQPEPDFEAMRRLVSEPAEPPPGSDRAK
jgi:hypothetical protein